MNEIPKDLIHLICQKLPVVDINSLEASSKQYHSYLFDFMTYARRKPSICNKDLYTSFLYCKDYNDIIKKISVFDIFNALRGNLRFERYNFDLQHAVHTLECARLQMNCKLTPQQEEVSRYQTDADTAVKEIIMVQAFAGTGKTKTLIEYCKNQPPDERILYLAFNSSLAKSAQSTCMGNMDNVHVSTIHSFALNSLCDDFVVRSCSSEDIQEHLSVSKSDAAVINRMLNNFFSSCSKKISANHLGSIRQTLNGTNIEDFFVQSAVSMWNAFLNKKVPIPHDGYLKLFQLSRPFINAEHILLDEAQDSTPCILHILLRQTHSVRILVGDINQQIYGFRGVCNPFTADLATPASPYQCNRLKYYSLDTTFRFGPELTFLTNQFLTTFTHKKCCIISNLDKDYTKVFPYNFRFSPRVTKPYVLITRTRLQIFIEAFERCLTQRVQLIGSEDIDCDKEIEILTSLHKIHTGIGDVDILPEIQDFDTLNDIVVYYKLLGVSQWGTRISLYKTFGLQTMTDNWNLLKQNLVSENADILMTTAHQSKGLEYDNVIIANDFVTLHKGNHIRKPMKDDCSEHNILYVAMTRARKELILNEELTNFVRILKKKRKYYTDKKIYESCHECGSKTSGKNVAELVYGNSSHPTPICDTCFDQSY